MTVWGNFSYAYAGYVNGYTHDQLLKDAGYGQFASDLISVQGVTYDKGSNWDEPADLAAVRIGIELWSVALKHR